MARRAKASGASAVSADTNPHTEGSAQWAAFENFKRQEKGLPATNNFDGPDTVKLIQKHAAFMEVDYKNSK
jgi:hypothetical protein